MAELLGVLFFLGQTRLSCGDVTTELEFPAKVQPSAVCSPEWASAFNGQRREASLAIIVAYAGPAGSAEGRAGGPGRRREGGVEKETTRWNGSWRNVALGFDDLCIVAAECHRAIRRAIPGRRSLPYKQTAVRGRPTMRWPALGRSICMSDSGASRRSVWGMSLSRRIDDTDRCDSELYATARPNS